MRSIIFIILVCTLPAFHHSDPVIEKEEAQKAFLFLNKIRTQPEQHLAQFSFLKGMVPRAALKWNDTLAKVAEARAMDLAKRKYFAHVDQEGFGVNHYINAAGYVLPKEWIAEKNANYFESLSAGSVSGIDAISNLLIDANTPSLGHRKHLLGLTTWDSSLVDIGIGYVNAPSSPYSSYACVIIAKRNW
jgi:uncharacterized protein YkwD